MSCGASAGATTTGLRSIAMAMDGSRRTNSPFFALADMNRHYELAVPAETAKNEWRQFELADHFVRGLGEVRFDAADETHSRLSFAAPGETDTLAMDAAVQRFRDRLARKGLNQG